MAETKKYVLYVSEIQPIPDGVVYSLVPSHREYMLIYTDNGLQEKDGFVPLDEKEVTNRQEREWLTQSKFEINVKYLREREAEYSSAMNDFLNLFEKELEKLTNAKKEEPQARN